MKRFSTYLLALALLCTGTSCRKNWLELTPQTIITDDQVYNDPTQITGLLANFYNRLPSDYSMDGYTNMSAYDDAMWSGLTNNDGLNSIASYANNRWALWDYGLIRDLNLAIENIATYGSKLTAAQKSQFISELRFIRAFDYFEMVKRMGGVPIITKTLNYDYSGDPTPLQFPRNKEAEVYDFIASECDAIKADIGNITFSSTGSIVSISQSRATKYSAMALKCRAMLYAASVAKWNAALTPTITTAGGEVGVPLARANEYYQKSIDAALEIINSGNFALYKNNAVAGENFYDMIAKKTNNKEVIFAKDYLVSKGKNHLFAYDNIVRSIREDNLSSSNCAPSLNLVEAFDYLDGSNGALKLKNAGNTDYIYYDKPADAFANKDARLYGTVVYPGATFKGITIDIQAGTKTWNTSNSTYTTTESADLGTYTSDGKLLTSPNGPARNTQEVSNTGFYMRKFVDVAPGSSTRGIRSDIWWVWFRLGEMYLNAAEASFELGNVADAVTYTNAIRSRAGFSGTGLYTAATISRDKIRAEFRTEFAFEDHRLWDLVRWRQADKVWNGSTSSADAMVYALYPYRVIRPGDAARDGKYVFDKIVAPRFKLPRLFQTSNYYSFIAQGVLDNNPKIVRNPFQ